VGRKHSKAGRSRLTEHVLKDDMAVRAETGAPSSGEIILDVEKPKEEMRTVAPILYVCGSDPQTARYEMSDKDAPICEACGRPMTAQPRG